MIRVELDDERVIEQGIITFSSVVSELRWAHKSSGWWTIVLVGKDNGQDFCNLIFEKKHQNAPESFVTLRK